MDEVTLRPQYIISLTHLQFGSAQHPGNGQSIHMDRARDGLRHFMKLSVGFLGKGSWEEDSEKVPL